MALCAVSIAYMLSRRLTNFGLVLVACVTDFANRAPAQQVIVAGGLGDARNLNERNSDTHTAWVPPRNLAAWNRRKTELRAQILAAAGLLPLPPRAPLAIRRHGAPVVRQKFTVEKISFESLPGLRVAGNLYLPVGARRVPAVLVAHGHWKHGRVHHEEDYSVPALCVGLASQGIAAFAWDMVGYNDTRQLPHEFGDSTEELAWSFHPLGVQLWNTIRAIDLLQSLDTIDPKRIGITGASGGGTQTFLASAVDERIAAAAPVNMVSAGFQGDDACEMAPSLRLGTNNVEIAAMTAPRPLLLISSTKDWTKNTPREEYPLVRSVYELFGAANRSQQAQVDAGHNYNLRSRQAAYTFFARTLKNAAAVIEEPPMDLDAEHDLLFGGEFQKAEKDAKRHVFEVWKSLHAPSSLTMSDWRNAFEMATGVRWPARVRTAAAGSVLVLSRSCCGDRIPVEMLPGASAKAGTVVQIHEDGIREAAKTMPATGSARLLVDVFQRGSAIGARPRPSGDTLEYLTYHMSDDANRLQDMLSAIVYAGQRGPVRLQCAGSEKFAALCTVAVALSRIPVTLELMSGRDGTKAPDLPGFERLGGLSEVRRRAANGVATSLSATRTVQRYCCASEARPRSGTGSLACARCGDKAAYN